MKNFLNNIIPEIKRYSKKLNDTSSFMNVPWSFVDEESIIITYIFRNKGELLIMKQGDIITGNWEYLAVLDSILVTIGDKKEAYNQGFINDVVMLLRKDSTNVVLPLANRDMLPNLDIENYIKTVLLKNNKGLHETSEYIYSKNRLKTIDGKEVEIEGKGKVGRVLEKNKTVKTDNIPAKNGLYFTLDNKAFDVNNGLIVNVYGTSYVKAKSEVNDLILLSEANDLKNDNSFKKLYDENFSPVTGKITIKVRGNNYFLKAKNGTVLYTEDADIRRITTIYLIILIITIAIVVCSVI
jgi:hypothetical protein